MLKLMAATLGTTLLVIGAVVLFSADGPTAATDNQESHVAANAKNKDTVMTDKTDKNNPDLKARLTPEQYRVTQQCGTEPAFSGKYYNHHEDGSYRCVVCDNILFQSETKFESGSGWPSFFKPVAQDAVKEKTDTTFGMTRTEITCGKCGAHLGHVFPDGPRPTGLRYCVNSASLDFKKSPADSVEKKDPSLVRTGHNERSGATEHLTSLFRDACRTFRAQVRTFAPLRNCTTCRTCTMWYNSPFSSPAKLAASNYLTLSCAVVCYRRQPSPCLSRPREFCEK